MLSTRRERRPDVEELKNEIIRLIDENTEVAYKIAFYSQPEVREILDRVIKRWEMSGFCGKPIDYATADEIKTLYKVARKICSKKPGELWNTYGRMFMPSEHS